MTKYIAYKIFDTNEYNKVDWDTIRKKHKVGKHYTIVHEDYAVLELQSELKQGRYAKK